MSELIKAEGLTKLFKMGFRRNLTAVNRISFHINKNETFGLIGESGSGKSTVGRCLLNLLPINEGKVEFKGKNFSDSNIKQRAKMQREMQMVFQDPYYSLNPRRTIWETVDATLRANPNITASQRKEMIEKALEKVYIDKSEYDKYPHQISAGQQQRVGIARAIAANPEFIVLDEPTSSLDISIRAEIIDLLVKLQKDIGVSYLFISHDLSTIQYICHRVAIMYLGTIVEYGTVDQLFKNYAHPYSKALMASVMSVDPKVKRTNYHLTGEITSAINLPNHCPLASRCAEAEEKCFKEQPPMVEVEEGHCVKCFHAKSFKGA